MSEEKRVWTVTLGYSPIIPSVHEWVFIGESKHLIRVKFNGVVNSIYKKNNAFFFKKEEAIRYRENVILAAIRKLELQLENKSVIVEPSGLLPADIKL